MDLVIRKKKTLLYFYFSIAKKTKKRHYDWKLDSRERAERDIDTHLAFLNHFVSPHLKEIGSLAGANPRNTAGSLIHVYTFALV
jgi:hypothetical protein